MIQTEGERAAQEVIRKRVESLSFTQILSKHKFVRNAFQIILCQEHFCLVSSLQQGKVLKEDNHCILAKTMKLF